MIKLPSKTMLMKTEENATSSEVAKTLCPTVGANCRGSKSDSKYRGYELGGKVLATVRLYAGVYEFRPLSEEVKALRLGARRLSTGLWEFVLQGVRTLVPEEGVAYIECARTPARLHYKGTNVHKVGALLVTPALSTLNAHED